MGTHQGARTRYRPINLQVVQVGPLKIAAADCRLAGFSLDSRWLFAGGGDQAFVWDTDRFNVKKEFKKVTHFAFSQDSLHLAIYQPLDGQIQVVELENGQVTDLISRPHGDVWSLYFFQTTAELAIVMHPRYNPDALDRYDRMQEEETFFETRPVVGRQEAVARAQQENGVSREKPFPALIKLPHLYQDGVSREKQYAKAEEQGTTTIYDMNTNKAIYRTRAFVKATHLSQDGQYMLVVTGKDAQVLELPEGTTVRQIAGARRPPNEQEGYGLPHTVWILDRANYRLIDGVTGETVQDLADLGAPQLGHIAVSPDGRYVAGMDCLERTLRIRDLNTGSTITRPDGRFRASDQLKFSPDSAMLLVQGDPAYFVC